MNRRCRSLVPKLEKVTLEKPPQGCSCSSAASLLLSRKSHDPAKRCQNMVGQQSTRKVNAPRQALVSTRFRGTESIRAAASPASSPERSHLPKPRLCPRGQSLPVPPAPGPHPLLPVSVTLTPRGPHRSGVARCLSFAASLFH